MTIIKEKNEQVLSVVITLEKNEFIFVDEKELFERENEVQIICDIAEGATCEYYTSGNAKKIERFARVHSQAIMKWFDIMIAHDDMESTINTELLADGAKTDISSVVYCVGKSQCLIKQSVFHISPNTSSAIICRGIAFDTGKIVYRSLIDMVSGVDGAVGKQKAEFLIASPKAIIEAIPDLAIRHHTVQCSHGVSITKLQDMSLFFLTSRGIVEEEAKKILLMGHTTFILENIKDEKIRNYFLRIVDETLTEKYGN